MALFDNGSLQQTGTREDLASVQLIIWSEFLRFFHRLSIEFSIITLGDILPLLITTGQKKNKRLHEFYRVTTSLKCSESDCQLD